MKTKGTIRKTPQLELALLRCLPYPTLSMCEAECLAALQIRAFMRYKPSSIHDGSKRQAHFERERKKEAARKAAIIEKPKIAVKSLKDLFEARLERK